MLLSPVEDDSHGLDETQFVGNHAVDHSDHLLVVRRELGGETAAIVNLAFLVDNLQQIQHQLLLLAFLVLLLHLLVEGPLPRF